jgi:hypothetical protein
LKVSIEGLIIALVALGLVVLVYSIYSYVVQLEVPLWMLQYTFYAFMTAIFGFIFLGILAPYVRDRMETGKTKKLSKRDELTALKQEYERFQWYINNISIFMERNERIDPNAQLNNTIDMGQNRVDEALQREVKEYNKRLGDYNIFRKASEGYIRESIEKKVNRMFPISQKNGVNLEEKLLDGTFMQKYFNGEPVTCNWLRDKFPIVLNNINKDIVESERYELDILFSEINTEFQKEEILLRYRQQKEAIKEHGRALVTPLQNEIPTINRKLRKYDYLIRYGATQGI